MVNKKKNKENTIKYETQKQQDYQNFEQYIRIENQMISEPDETDGGGLTQEMKKIKQKVHP